VDDVIVEQDEVAVVEDDVLLDNVLTKG